MKKAIHLFKIAVLIALVTEGGALRGADKTNATAAEAHPRFTGTGRDKPSDWERPMKEIKFDGLPLSEIVRVLRQEYPDVNFVVTSKVESEGIRMFLRN